MALRDVKDEDLAVFFEHQRDPEASRMAAFPARERDAFFAHWRAKVLANPGSRKMTVVVDGEVAGNMLSWEQDERRLVGYWIGREHWGRGVATAALAEFVADHEKTRPLFAHVATRNVASLRVLEKCGFRRDGESETGEDGAEELLMRLDR
jgi:RimJ/RimL family protein N-acetyltransferase